MDFPRLLLIYLIQVTYTSFLQCDEILFIGCFSVAFSVEMLYNLIKKNISKRCFRWASLFSHINLQLQQRKDVFYVSQKTLLHGPIISINIYIFCFCTISFVKKHSKITASFLTAFNEIESNETLTVLYRKAIYPLKINFYRNHNRRIHINNCQGRRKRDIRNFIRSIPA